MGEAELPRDLEAAAASGEAFGRDIGKRIASEMMQAGLSDMEVSAIGAEGVKLILSRADSLADRGLDRTIVASWIEAAAEAFNTELDRAVALLGDGMTPSWKH